MVPVAPGVQHPPQRLVHRAEHRDVLRCPFPHLFFYDSPLPCVTVAASAVSGFAELSASLRAELGIRAVARKCEDACMDEATEIDKAWRRLVDGGPYWWSDHPIFQLAYEHPTLRALLPFPSHGTLSFYGTVWPPHPARRPDRLAFVVCDGPPYNVYRGADYDQLVGTADTAEDALTLLIESLQPLSAEAIAAIERRLNQALSVAPPPWCAALETREATGGESVVQFRGDPDVDNEMYLTVMLGTERLTSPDPQLDLIVDFVGNAAHDVQRLIAEVRRLRALEAR